VIDEEFRIIVWYIKSNQTKPSQAITKKQLKTTAMCKTFKSIAALPCTFNLYAQLLNIVTAAASLRGTVRSKVQQENNSLWDATAFQDTETLKLTDDDAIAFFRNEVEHGYLDREWWDKALLASQIKDDDDHVVDDDQFRDPATGGFLPVEAKLEGH